MRYRTYQRGGRQGVAALDGSIWRDLGALSLLDMIDGGKLGDRALLAGKPEMDWSSAKLLPPLPRPRKILCVGLNYVEHAAESPYKDPPKYPVFFARFSTGLIADGDPLIRPKLSADLDYECELVAVIVKTARKVSVEQALDHVVGYSIFNDGSLRDYQFIIPQWTVGKNFDGTGAFGPELVTSDELPAGCVGLTIQTILNGKVEQSANTSDMIFPVANLVSIASQTMTLEPGDIIVTGTPAGVGLGKKPPVYMKHGDLCEIVIEKVGKLANRIADEVD